MVKDIESVLITEQEVKDMVSRLADRINEDYKDKFPVFIGVLKGSFVFMADLIRQIKICCEIDFMAVSSYGNKSVTTGAVKIYKDLEKDIENRDVIIVEDILDSGLTLNYLMGYLRSRNPSSLRLCTLLDKPARRMIPITADYKGFEIPDAFVVGYGLDYQEKYRNLPYIGILKPEIYTD
ncbi:MAG: hypoxanthine phosphoribosyltransferase [Clostridiales bacterium]|jgi:hypoxanthine phosphoribosyltransferase|nr:hypoxanthine phosphoribosyltransferase [Clostridiales bacterium]